MAKPSRCKNCGAFIDGTPKMCPPCGTKLKHSSSWLWILLTVIAIYFLMSSGNTSTSLGTSSNSPKGTETQKNDIPMYDGEITFQDYAWETSVMDISQKTGEQFFESVTPGWSDADTLMQTSLYSVGYRIFTIRDRNIAGYNVANFSMYFMYGHDGNKLSTAPENSELYLVTMNFDVADIDGTYDDLLEKITKLYGEGISSNKTGRAYSMSEGAYKYEIVTTKWFGQNNTGIVLSKCIPQGTAPDSADMFHNYVVLSYGKTNSDKTLSLVYNEYKQVVSEAEQESRDALNTKGL